MAYSDEMWAEAKKKCRLNQEDIALAKRLGLNPRSLIKNIPSKSEPWKAEAAPEREVRRGRPRQTVNAPVEGA